MAIVQSTDLRIKIEPRIKAAEFDWGPSDSVAANAVLLTAEHMRSVGAYPARVGIEFDCLLWVYQVVAGVETIMNMTPFTLTATYWDPFARVANSLTVANAGASGYLTLSYDHEADLTAGMYRFLVRAVEGVSNDPFDLCSGWFEILPAIPS